MTTSCRWSVFRRQIVDPLVARLGKPFVFTEAAANSVDCVLSSGNASETGRADVGEQALYVQSLMDAFRGDTAFFGTFWWEYTFVPGAGGLRDRSAAIRLKPASNLVAEAYGGIPDSAMAVVLDGEGGEWSTDYRLAEDRVGDQRLPSKPDARSLYGQVSDGYLYLMVRFAAPVTDDRLEYSLFYISHRPVGEPEFMIPFGIYDGYAHVVVNGLPSGDVVAYGDGAFAGTDFEVRIPLGLFLGAHELYVSFGNHSVEEGSVVWNDAIGWDTGTYYGPVRSR
jgi:hypothetical protein